MAKVRKIYRVPKDGRKNYYLLDACFIVTKYLPIHSAPDALQTNRLRRCHHWWHEIGDQLRENRARIYIPDVCIAEAFKVLAKKYYDKKEKWFTKWNDYDKARKSLAKDITISPEVLQSPTRQILYHDISTCRDIIISVDRYYRIFIKHKKFVEIPDLIIVATSKYLMDFFDIPKRQFHIVTTDEKLWSGAKNIPELPYVYDPTQPNNYSEKIFI